jgi:hypothetical protein
MPGWWLGSTRGGGTAWRERRRASRLATPYLWQGSLDLWSKSGMAAMEQVRERSGMAMEVRDKSQGEVRPVGQGPGRSQACVRGAVRCCCLLVTHEWRHLYRHGPTVAPTWPHSAWPHMAPTQCHEHMAPRRPHDGPTLVANGAYIALHTKTCFRQQMVRYGPWLGKLWRARVWSKSGACQGEVRSYGASQGALWRSGMATSGTSQGAVRERSGAMELVRERSGTLGRGQAMP